MSRDMERKNRFKRLCFECGEPIRRSEGYITLEVFESPWGPSKTIYVHTANELSADYPISCRQALYDEHWAGFRYFDCPQCDRTIIRQCPSNGWHTYVRITDDGEEICLRCYEQDLLEHGISREQFEQHTIAGIFFNQEERRNQGWERVIWDAFLCSETSVESYCREAIQYIDRGFKVVTDYERLGLGVGEGYVSLWVKRNGKGQHIGIPEPLKTEKEVTGHGRLG